MTIYIIWFVLFGLIAFSFFSEKFLIWTFFIAYALIVGVRIKQKIGDYNDWVKKSKNDENLKIRNVANNAAINGYAYFFIAEQQKEEIAKDSEYERKKRKRQFEVELIDCLFLKK